MIMAGLLTFIFSGVSCNTQPEKKQTLANASGKDIEVYYFHMTVRCSTCLAIEAETRKNLELLYPELYKEGKVSFTALNLEESTGKAMGEKLGVNGQTLLIVSGDQKINITTDAFLYAVGEPDKFKDVIKEKVDLLIK